MTVRLLTLAATAALVLATAASAHEFDHPAPGYSADAPVSMEFNSGGPGASWDLVTTFPTGNPHTDLDFFTQRGEIYASVGTLAAGANGAGQTIVQLTQGGEVSPRPRATSSATPRPSCPSNPAPRPGSSTTSRRPRRAARS